MKIKYDTNNKGINYPVCKHRPMIHVGSTKCRECAFCEFVGKKYIICSNK